MDVRVSVDGQNGNVLARTAGLPEGSIDNPLQALVRLGDLTRNGQNGAHARAAIPGSPAGLLAVELTESQVAQGSIHVDFVTVESTQQLGAPFDVPVRQDILFTAVGGAGENGHNGGDGQRGMNGVHGIAATRATDATNGTDGGDGGDAGRGTNGADGGNGGIVQIILDENNTHLLMAVKCDVRGGQGGNPGEHGQPGDGGTGGRGGEGHKWTEDVGYKYSCTSNCIPITVPTGSSTSTALTRTGTALRRAGSRLDTETMALTSRIRAQPVQGGNLNAMIAEVAARYGARRHQNVDHGACRCKPSGTGNCIGCAMQPISKDFQRARGFDGSDGRPGAQITTPLLAGVAGMDGKATYHVRRADGTIQEYTSCYHLELVDFDIEDENQDGIFEPGEHLFIRRIQVRNTGGMPSPTCAIPVSVVRSDWLIPVDDEHGHAFLPISIAEGNTATLEGSIKVLIQPNQLLPTAGTLFHQRIEISIQAVMPWLDRTLPDFEYTKTVELQFPCELQNINCLSSIGQGSTGHLNCEIYNKCNKRMGSEAPSPRAVEVNVTVPTDYGTLLAPSGTWDDNITQDIAIISAQGGEAFQQLVRIRADAESYQHVHLIVDLYIAAPLQQEIDEQNNRAEMILVQRVEVRIQISSHYVHNPRSSFLLVTNSETTRDRAQALQSFISEILLMEFDTWNIDLYGGLDYQGVDGAANSHVFTAYHGKSIILLGNTFQFFESGARTVVELCDIRCLAEAMANGTSCLILESAETNSFNKLAHSVVLYSEHNLSHVQKHLSDSKRFAAIEDLVKSVAQETQLGFATRAIYSIPVTDKWYRIGKVKPKSVARKTARYLGKHLPQERFLVTFVESQPQDLTEKWSSFGSKSPGANRSEVRTDLSSLPNERTDSTKIADHGQILVSRGLPHQNFLVRAESQPIDEPGVIGVGHAVHNVPQHTGTRLGQFESYMIVAALPLKKRVDIIWRVANHSISADGRASLMRASTLSIISDVQRDIQIFLRTAPSLDDLVPKEPNWSAPDTSQRFFYTHLPSLAVLFNHPHTTGAAAPPQEVLDVLQHSIIFALPQKKRHIAREVLFPFLQRRCRLYRLLVATIDHILVSQKSYSVEALKDFHRTARELHSRLDGNKRDSSRLMIRRGATLTQKSEHAFEKSKMSASKVVPKTEYCGPAEWDARVMRNRERSIKVEREMEEARKALEKMISLEEV